MTPRTFLVHGLIAGLLAGIGSFLVAYSIGEPPIDAAIAVEEAAALADHDASDGHSHDEGITRGQQAGPGLATATILVSTVLGGLVGIASAFALGRFGRLGAVASTALVAAGGFLAFALVPWFKYPPNPPAVGSAETLNERTALYFGFVGLSVIVIVLAFVLAAQLTTRTRPWVAAVLPVLVYLAVMVIASILFGSVNEVPDSFPPNTLYEFRVGALLTTATMWGVIGIALTGLVARTVDRDRSPVTSA